MRKGIHVAVYLDPRVYKVLKKKAVDLDTTMGSLAGEACLWFLRDGQKKAIEEKKLRNEMAEVYDLQRELEQLQGELDTLLLTREENKLARKLGRRGKR